MSSPPNESEPTLATVHRAITDHIADDDRRAKVDADARRAADEMRLELASSMDRLHRRLDEREKQRADAEIAAAERRAELEAKHRTKRFQIVAGIVASLVTAAPVLASLYAGGPGEAAAAIVLSVGKALDSEDETDKP